MAFGSQRGGGELENIFDRLEGINLESEFRLTEGDREVETCAKERRYCNALDRMSIEVVLISISVVLWRGVAGGYSKYLFG